MTEAEVEKIFCEKIERNYKEFYADWLKMTSEELIENAAFVQATKAMYEYYKDGCDESSMRNLIGFENPLEILRDGIVSDMDGEINSIDYSLREICDSRSPDEIYEKDFRYYEADSESQGVRFGM